MPQRSESRSVGEPFEALPAPGGALDDLDWDLVRDYLHAANRMALDQAGGLSVAALAHELRDLGGLMRADDAGANERPSYAAMLLFGRAPQRFVPSAEIVLVRYTGSSMGDEYLRSEVRGSLPQQIRSAEAFLLDNMRRGSRINGWRREEQTEYPVEAVREAVINAVAHRDYAVRGEGIRVLMFADRIEVSSPGRLPGHVTLDNLVDERFSRNWAIVRVLAELGFIERLGYGIDRMIAAMDNAGLPRPIFAETANGFKVTLYGHGDRLLGERAERSRWSHLGLNERQLQALSYLTNHDRITNRAFQELCQDVSAETIRRDLAELVDVGLLLKIGDKKATYYIMK